VTFVRIRAGFCAWADGPRHGSLNCPREPVAASRHDICLDRLPQAAGEREQGDEGMGEVGVDPELVAKAATALEQLRDALAANVPTIVTNMSDYRSGVNTAVLKQAQSRSVGDAQDMRARARLAQLWQQQPDHMLGQGLVDIPWSGSALDSADAYAEAQALAQAECADPKVVAATLQAIQQDLKDHMGDPAWLATFYNNAAPYVASLATMLHNKDVNSKDFNNRFTVLTQADQQIMATFAAGLAAADKSGRLSPDAVQAIANAPDIWSASMLIKFGPPGSSWATTETKSPQNPDGLSLLAVLTSNVYRDMQAGKINIPLGGGYNRYGLEDRNQLQDTLANYDPLAVMLQADAQSKNAAGQVMGDTNPAYGNIGPSLAKLLLWNGNDLPSLDARFFRGEANDQGQYPGYFTVSPAGKSLDGYPTTIVLNFLDPKVGGSFLDAATSAPRGTSIDAQYSAQAAINIIDNTPSPNGHSGVKLDPAIQDALTHTAQRYLLDLAMSATSTSDSALLAPGVQLPAWSLQIHGQGDGNPLSAFLEQIASDQNNLAALNAAAKVTFGNIYAQTQLKTLPASLKDASADDAMARLLGRIDTAANNDGIDLMTNLDEQHKEYNDMLAFAESQVKYIPVAGEVLDKVVDPAKQVLGLLGVPTEFSTDNAAGAQLADAQSFAGNSTQLHITMAQALLNNHAPGLLDSAEKINAGLPPDRQFLQNGQIVLTKDNLAQFNGWYEGHAAGLYGLDKLEATYGWLYYQQGATSSKGAPGPW
jgi:hypothetical protein